MSGRSFSDSGSAPPRVTRPSGPVERIGIASSPWASTRLTMPRSSNTSRVRGWTPLPRDPGCGPGAASSKRQETPRRASSTARVRLRSPEHQLRLTDLGRQLAITTGGVTRLIDRLEAQELVERVRGTDDRRAIYARLTDKGRDTVIRVLPDHTVDLRTTFDALGPERQSLEHALRLLRDIVSVPSWRPCCYRRDSADAARSRAIEPATTRA